EHIDIARALVAIVQVVGVLPDVEREQRYELALERVLRVVAAAHYQPAARPLHEPRPARAKLFDRRLGELRAELDVGAERLVDPRGELALGLSSTARLHAEPVEV